MESYKQSWSGEGEWKYQCKELEDRYAAFVIDKQDSDA